MPPPNHRHIRRFVIVVGLFALLNFIQTIIHHEGERALKTLDEGEVVSVTSNSTAPSKPIMMTFFEPVKGGCCGMSEVGHEHLLHAWEQGWQTKGWETRILTAADAKKHPDFWWIEKELKRLGVDDYNRRCYWRWLAMASIYNDHGGGGWMSDYDVIPLALTAEVGQEVAKDDTFRSFSMHVPCLIHASREEWDRVPHLMIGLLPKKKIGGISDMFSLLSVRRKYGRSAMKWTNILVDGFPYVKNEDGKLAVSCKKVEAFAAGHLSHHGTVGSFNRGVYPWLEGVDNVQKALEKRGDAAIKLIKDIQEQCP